MGTALSFLPLTISEIMKDLNNQRNSRDCTSFICSSRCAISSLLLTQFKVNTHIFVRAIKYLVRSTKLEHRVSPTKTNTAPNKRPLRAHKMTTAARVCVSMSSTNPHTQTHINYREKNTPHARRRRSCVLSTRVLA